MYIDGEVAPLPPPLSTGPVPASGSLPSIGVKKHRSIPVSSSYVPRSPDSWINRGSIDTASDDSSANINEKEEEKQLELLITDTERSTEELLKHSGPQAKSTDEASSFSQQTTPGQVPCQCPPPGPIITPNSYETGCAMMLGSDITIITITPDSYDTAPVPMAYDLLTPHSIHILNTTFHPQPPPVPTGQQQQSSQPKLQQQQQLSTQNDSSSEESSSCWIGYSSPAKEQPQQQSSSEESSSCRVGYLSPSKEQPQQQSLTQKPTTDDGPVPDSHNQYNDNNHDTSFAAYGKQNKPNELCHYCYETIWSEQHDTECLFKPMDNIENQKQQQQQLYNSLYQYSDSSSDDEDQLPTRPSSVSASKVSGQDPPHVSRQQQKEQQLDNAPVSSPKIQQSSSPTKQQDLSPPHRNPSQANPNDDPLWRCDSCTFENRNNYDHCEICLTPKFGKDPSQSLGQHPSSIKAQQDVQGTIQWQCSSCGFGDNFDTMLFALWQCRQCFNTTKPQQQQSTNNHNVAGLVPYYSQRRNNDNDNYKSRYGGGYRKNDGGHRKNDGGYRKNDAGYRKNDGGYRKNDGGYRKNDAGYSGGYHKNHVGYRKNDGGSGHGGRYRQGGTYQQRGGYRHGGGHRQRGGPVPEDFIQQQIKSIGIHAGQSTSKETCTCDLPWWDPTMGGKKPPLSKLRFWFQSSKWKMNSILNKVDLKNIMALWVKHNALHWKFQWADAGDVRRCASYFKRKVEDWMKTYSWRYVPVHLPNHLVRGISEELFMSPNDPTRVPTHCFCIWRIEVVPGPEIFLWWLDYLENINQYPHWHVEPRY